MFNSDTIQSSSFTAFHLFYWFVHLGGGLSFMFVQYLNITWLVGLPRMHTTLKKMNESREGSLSGYQGLKTHSYATRLNQLKIPSLELRRLHVDLI